jgi:peptidoglycan/xylan/chitin deacetylase (PgdA/CDA1 family)
MARDDYDVGIRRYLVKKLARTAVVFGATLTARPPGGVHVLTYHRFGRSKRDPFCVTVGEFEQQMAYLARARRAVSLDGLLDHLDGRRSLPDGSVLVTIDDGDASVFDLAWPVLRSHGIPAVVFPIVGSIETPGFLGWRQVERLHAEGVEIGSHSLTHRSMARISRLDALHEMTESRRLLASRLGAEVRSFAFPFGTRRDYDDATAEALWKAGYRCGFTSQHGAVVPGERYRLPRVKVEGGDPSWLFPRLCRGGMDAWRFIDRVSAPLQAPHRTDQRSTS